MFTIIRDLRRLIAMANEISAQTQGDAPRWSLFITSRSFIAIAIAVGLNLLPVLGVPVPAMLAGVVPDLLAGHVVDLATAGLAVYAGVERLLGKTRTVWNKRQAIQAVQEADAFAGALTGAGVDGVVSVKV